MTGSISAADFVEAARTWIGVPFHHQGRSRAGVDCVGLPESILRDHGAVPAHYATPLNYGRLPAAELEAGLARWCTRTAAPEPGGLIVLRWARTTRPSHVAIYTGSELIHAYRAHGHVRGVVCHSYRGIWPKLAHSFWRLPGVDYPA